MEKRTGRALHLLLSVQLTAAVVMMAGVAHATDVGAHLVHHATSENTTDAFSVFDHPLTDGQSHAIFHVTQNWNPPGSPGVYNESAIGVYYYLGKWSVFDRDTSTIPPGSSYNIWIPPADSTTFVHTATAGNITNNWTTVDNSATNNNPDALLLVTMNLNPDGGKGSFTNNVLGVWYDPFAMKWTIFNQDRADMSAYVSFNVTVLPDESTVFVHTATPANTTGDWTSIDHPLTDNNPNAIVSITQNWNPDGAGGVYNDHAVGVLYHDGISKWAVFNQDGAAMPVGASFNVTVAAPKIFNDGFESGNTSAWSAAVP